MKIKINRKINETSAVTGGGVQGHVENELEEELEEAFSTSGALMGAGSGQIPHERSEEGHKRHAKRRHDEEGLLNFKPNRYFAENQAEKPKIKIKIVKKLGERCEKGYKTHEKRKTKKMFGKTYRNCVPA